MRRLYLLIAVAFLSAPVAAQEIAPLTGNWVATFAGGNGSPREAQIQIKENGGTFHLSGGANRENPCLSIEAPIEVSNLTADSFDLGVYRSKVLAGCPDGKATMKRVNEATYEGQFADGRKFVLSRH